MSSMQSALSKLDKEQLSGVLTKLAASVAKKYRTEAVAEIDTNLETLLLEFRDHVVHRSWLAAQQWCRWEDERFVLFPDYTRIYYRKGTREVLVQEYPPQVRIMSFRENLARAKNSEVSMDWRVPSKDVTYALALPYTVFIFNFHEGIFHDVSLGFSDRPLKDCHEPVYRPYLSNIDSNLKVCLGAGLDSSQFIRGNVAQQAAYVLSHFWQTTYSDEWSSHFWANKAHFEKHDKRLSTLDRWQEASNDNPLFVIEDVQWMRHNETSFGNMIQRIFESEPIDSKFAQDIYKQIYDVFEETIRKAIIEQLESADAKITPSVLNSLLEEFAVLIGAKVVNKEVS